MSKSEAQEYAVDLEQLATKMWRQRHEFLLHLTSKELMLIFVHLFVDAQKIRKDYDL